MISIIENVLRFGKNPKKTWQCMNKGGKDCQVSERKFSFVFQEDKVNHNQKQTGASETDGK